MAKSKQQKQDELQALEEKLAKSKGAVFANYLGLTVTQVQDLREQLREEEAEMIVAKKTLIDLALNNAGLGEDHVQNMEGGVAIFLGYKDEVAPAKVVATFAKDHEVVELRGGILEGQVIDAEKAIALSKLPSKQELLGQMVGSLRSPISGFVNVLGGNMRGLVQVLNQIKESKA